MGIDDESSHPSLCSEVADSVTCRFVRCVSFPRAGCGKSACPVRRAGTGTRAKPNRIVATTRKPRLFATVGPTGALSNDGQWVAKYNCKHFRKMWMYLSREGTSGSCNVERKVANPECLEFIPENATDDLDRFISSHALFHSYRLR